MAKICYHDSKELKRAVFYAKGVIIVDKEKEKQDTRFYKSEIIKMIESIDNADILSYTYVILKDVVAENNGGVVNGNE